MLGVLQKLSACVLMRGPTSPTLPAISARRTSALLSCHPRLISPCSLLPHIKTCDRPRRGAIKRDFDHGDLIPLQRRTNRLPGCGTRADKSTTTWTPGEGLRLLSEQPAPIAKQPSCSRPSKVRHLRADLDRCCARQPCKSWLMWHVSKDKVRALSSNRVAVAGQSNVVSFAVLMQAHSNEPAEFRGSRLC